MFAGFMVVSTTNVLAANKGSLHISSPVSVAGKRLAAGDYTVQWTGAGPEIEVKVMQGKKVLTTASAIVTKLTDTSNNDAVIITSHSDGSQSVSQIFLSGKKWTLKILGTSGNSQVDSN